MVLLLSCRENDKNHLLSTDYLKTLKNNQEERAKNRIKYLELTGLFKLDSVNNTFGKNPTNNFVLDIQYLPSRLGSVTLSKNELKFNALDNSQITDGLGNKIDSLVLNTVSYTHLRAHET